MQTNRLGDEIVSVDGVSLAGLSYKDKIGRLKSAGRAVLVVRGVVRCALVFCVMFCCTFCVQTKESLTFPTTPLPPMSHCLRTNDPTRCLPSSQPGLSTLTERECVCVCDPPPLTDTQTQTHRHTDTDTDTHTHRHRHTLHVTTTTTSHEQDKILRALELHQAQADPQRLALDALTTLRKKYEDLLFQLCTLRRVSLLACTTAQRHRGTTTHARTRRGRRGPA